MNNEAQEMIDTETIILVSKAQKLLWMAMEVYGEAHPLTQMAREEWERLNEEAEPARRRQMASIAKEFGGHNEN